MPSVADIPDAVQPEPPGLIFADDLLDLLALDFAAPDDLDPADLLPPGEPEPFEPPSDADVAWLVQDNARRQRDAELRAYYDGLSDREWDDYYESTREPFEGWDPAEIVYAAGHSALARING